ncbi:FecCD family ABC transporter permease [Occultella kanbiaonis]|uniref:FecCD family ABC transporter permease n=1 Tax=Occultella kanbiaonis TaxID=2675754 RepID=UPI001E41E66D|nr:iron chelate uptake ABC transporter family permease subunit [Occultella kanbiaonis]
MSTASTTRVTTASRARGRRWLLLLAVLALAVMLAVSMLVGSGMISVAESVHQLLHPSDRADIVWTLRVPRALLGVLCGAAFAVAGALIQALTRNPLADPGILGVNAGAGFAVVLAVAILGLSRVQQFLPYSFLGAVLATVLVYLLSTRGTAGASPVRFILVGVALAAVLGGMSQTLALLNPTIYDRMRFWGAGSITDRPPETVGAVVWFIVAGLVLAMLCAGPLNTMALGDDMARSLGVPVAALQVACVVAITLLCGAATAAAGPIGFVGLMVPHIVRWITGPDQRWVIPGSMLVGAVLLLTADVIGRVVLWPTELQVGVVTAFIGAPVLVLLVRRRGASGL